MSSKIVNIGGVPDELIAVISQLLTEIEKGDQADPVLLKKFHLRLANLRNQLAIEKGFQNYLEMMVNHKARDFHLKAQDLIELFLRFDTKKLIPTSFDSINLPKFVLPDEVLLLVEKTTHATLPEIKYSLAELQDYASYQKVGESYEISLPNNTHPVQKVSMLIHELCHVINHQHQVNITNQFENENQTMKLEFQVASSISKKFLDAVKSAYSSCVTRVQAEINLYQTFSTPVDDSGWLKDTKIVLTPFCDWPAAYGLYNNL